jgi:hypothetical protein
MYISEFEANSFKILSSEILGRKKAKICLLLATFWFHGWLSFCTEDGSHMFMRKFDFQQARRSYIQGTKLVKNKTSVPEKSLNVVPDHSIKLYSS